jgi:hypothetical protein
MKTCAQLVAWIEGATAELGDPAEAVGQAFFRWAENWRTSGEDLVIGREGQETMLVLGAGAAIPFPIKAGEPEISDEGIVAFGAEEITPGVWAVTPSLNVPGLVHVFVVLYGVPSPAPWERRIIVPAGLEVPA